MRGVVREFPARTKTERKRQSARELGLYSQGYGGKGEGARGGRTAPAARLPAGSGRRLWTRARLRGNMAQSATSTQLRSRPRPRGHIRLGLAGLRNAVVAGLRAGTVGARLPPLLLPPPPAPHWQRRPLCGRPRSKAAKPGLRLPPSSRLSASSPGGRDAAGPKARGAGAAAAAAAAVRRGGWRQQGGGAALPAGRAPGRLRPRGAAGRPGEDATGFVL